MDKQNEVSIDTPNNEDRIIKGGTLKNLIKYITIHDINLDITSVVVSVNIGSLAENIEFQGLAHFLEHMLFLGSKKYPNADYYNNLINSNGGSFNAYTENTSTTYYFSIYNNMLDRALDVFSRFFIDPLFDEECVNKELNAVNSEHLKNINQDIWRFNYFKDIISKKNSIINKFSTGNFKSLQKDNLRNEMINFFEKYYIPSNISVVVASSLSNNSILEKIKNTFENIIEKPYNNITISKPLYDVGNTSYFLKSIDYIYKISYLWEINETKYYKNSHLSNILACVFNSQNDKSLKLFLLKKGLIKDLICYVEDHGVFILDIHLYNFKNLKEINSYIRYYIINLQNHDWHKIIEYYQKKDILLFNNSSKDSSLDLALFLASNIFDYDISQVWSGPSIIKDIDMNGMLKLIKKINSDNVKIILSSKNSSDNITITEPYYNLKFSKIDFNKLNFDSIKKFNYEIINNNKYLDTKPNIIKKLTENNLPIAINKYGGKIWFGNITKFNEPLIISTLIFTNLEYIINIKNYVEINIFLAYLQTKISEKFYLLFEIGFTTSIQLIESTSQIVIKISGYNDNFNLFFNDIINYIKSFTYEDMDEYILKTKIKNMIYYYKNIKSNSPYIYDLYLEQLNINQYSYERKKIITYLKSIKITDFINRIDRLKNIILYQSKFTSFIYGNINYKMLFRTDNNLNINFPNIKKYENILKIKTNIITKHPNKNETNNFVKYSYHIGEFNPLNNLYLLILNIGFSNMFYSDLRSNQQFGYIVNANISIKQKNYYFEELVQSDKSTKDIENAIIIFNKNYLNKINKKDFNKFVESAKNMLLEKDTKMSDLFLRYFNEIIDSSFLFNRKQLLINQLKNVNYTNFKIFYNNMILNGCLSKSIIKTK